MQKWEVIRIHCDFLANPHDKFCICICPIELWFVFINSEPPQFRKARELAVSIENYEAAFLKHTSYIDTTRLEIIPFDTVDAALKDADRNLGRIAPFLQRRIIDAVHSHEVMEPKYREKLI